jgi:hypothetical protein
MQPFRSSLCQTPECCTTFAWYGHAYRRCSVPGASQTMSGAWQSAPPALPSGRAPPWWGAPPRCCSAPARAQRPAPATWRPPCDRWVFRKPGPAVPLHLRHARCHQAHKASQVIIGTTLVCWCSLMAAAKAGAAPRSPRNGPPPPPQHQPRPRTPRLHSRGPRGTTEARPQRRCTAGMCRTTVHAQTPMLVQVSIGRSTPVATPPLCQAMNFRLQQARPSNMPFNAAVEGLQ